MTAIRDGASAFVLVLFGLWSAFKVLQFLLTFLATAIVPLSQNQREEVEHHAVMADAAVNQLQATIAALQTNNAIIKANLEDSQRMMRENEEVIASLMVRTARDAEVIAHLLERESRHTFVIRKLAEALRDACVPFPAEAVDTVAEVEG